MRAVSVAFLLLVVSVFAETSPFDPAPRLSLNDLKQFTEKTTMGGGVLRTFEHAGRKIAVVMRCFTSGVRSSDFGVYAATPGGLYRKIWYREPVWGSFFRPVQDGDLITVRLEPSSPQDEKLAFTFTISGCFDLQDE